MAEAKMPTSLNEIYPGNSNKEKQEVKEKQTEPIVEKGVARKAKPSMGHKFRDTFDNEETRGILSYIWNEVLVPAAKDMLFEAVSGGLSMLFEAVSGGLSMRLFGSARGYSRPVRNGHTNYNKMSKPANARNVARSQTNQRGARPRIHNSYDVILPSKGLAFEALDRLCSSIEQCGYATVQDLCQVMNWESDYTDEYFGWDDLTSARIRPRGQEWILELPPTVSLNDDLPF